MRAGLLAVTLTTLLVAPGASGSECAREDASERPRIGLVLGGGGARGAAHIGVIQLLEELRIPVDYVTGTSMGALVGSLFATGMRAQELEATVEAIDFDALFKDQTEREDLPFRRKLDDNYALFGPKLGIGKDSQLLPRGAIQGQRISYLFETLTSQRTLSTDFDRLPIPFRAVATDLVTGDPVILGDGNLAVAMRASMSVPGAFDPVPRGDQLLVDGGLSNNLPIDVARGLGADVIIAVDVGTPLSGLDELRSVVDFTAQLSGLLVARNSMEQVATLTGEDVLVRPEIGDRISSADFDKVAKAIPIGRAGAEAVRAELARFSLAEADYAEHRRFIESCVAEAPVVRFVRLDNQSRFDDSVIWDRIHIEVGQPLDLVQLESDVKQIYALGFLDLARYELVEEEGEAGVLVHVTQDSRGRAFLEWGIDLSADGDDATINLRLAALKTDVDRFGSEARILTQLGTTPAIAAELYKFVNARKRFVFNPRLFAERRDVNLFDTQGNQIDVAEVDQYGADFLMLREFGRAAALSGGVRLFRGQTDLQVDTTDSNRSFDGGEYRLEFLFDRLDDRYIPNHGARAGVGYARADSSLGADDEYEQVTASLLAVRSFGHHTAIGGVRYDTTLDSNAPEYSLFRGGGLFNLSGLQPDQLSGQHFGSALASYRYHLAGSGLFPAYGGIAVEYGNAAFDRDDVFADGILNGSLYFGYRSPLGPLYWGVGFAEGGQREYFLRIGNVFGRTTIAR